MSGYTYPFNVVVEPTRARIQRQVRESEREREREAERAELPSNVLDKFYKYQPNPNDHTTTRFLALFPGSGDSVLEGNLQLLDVKSGDSYMAFSYVWGQPGLTREAILLDGNKKLAITPNLAAALRHFRSPSRVLWVWVDQICINQRDTVERSKQVRLMYMIYKNATEVLAWLGADDGDGAAGKAFGLARALLAIFNDDLLSSLFGKADAECSWIPEKRWKCLKQLCEVEWFRRVWIPQEIGTSTRASVHWGDQSLDWEVLCEAMHKLDSYPDLKRRHGIDSSRIASLHKRFLRQPDDIDEYARGSFVNQLCLSSKTEATDPRDYVFSLLGHYSARLPEGIPIIQPDYDNSVNAIYHEIAIRILRRPDYTPSLRLLNAVYVGGKSKSQRADTHKLPSWVPQWDCRHYSNLLGYPGIFEASGTRKSEITFDASFKQISVQGFIVDTIKTVADRSIPTGANSPWLGPHILPFMSICLGKDFHTDLKKGTWSSGTQDLKYAPPNTSITAIEAFLDTLAPEAIVLSLSSKISAYKSGLAAMERWFRKSKKQLRSLASKDGSKEGNAAAWLLVAEQNVRERSFAVTSTGYFVLAPPAAEKGDLVCVLFGGETPYILRSLSAETKEYQLIGEAYVNGLMGGEAIVMGHAGEISEENIKIR